MANRVTATEVRVLYNFDPAIINADADVFIKSANFLTNLVEAAGLTDADDLKEIERWLGAHLIAIRDPQAASERAGDVAQSLQQRVDLHFNQTRYGQQALIPDTTGTLAELQEDAVSGGKKKAPLFVIQTKETADGLTNP